MDISPAMQARANEAIAQHLGLWSTAAQEEALKQHYGFATYCFLQEAYRFAVSHPVDWSAETLPEALQKVQQGLRDAYPFLNEDSVLQLSNCFAYAWK